MSESVKLKDLLSFVVDNRGKTPPCTDDGNHELIEVNAIAQAQKYPQYDLVRKKVDDETYNNWFRKGHPEKDDILIPTVGTLDAISMMKENRGCIAQNMIALRVDERLSTSEFLYYYMSDRKFRSVLLNLDIGGVQPSLKVPHLMDMEINLPPLPEQKAIADTLSCLDEKIESNNKINQILEEMAQAIFKSWFVDFEPFQDEKFVESELGLIPEIFKVVLLEDICESVSKKHSFDENNLIFLNTGDVTKGLFHHNNEMNIADMPGQAKKSIQHGDILYSEIRPVNEHYAYVSFDSSRYVVSTKFMVIRGKSIDSRRLYQFLTTKEVIDTLQVEAIGRSGTFPQIRFENVGRLKMVIATEQIEKEFTDIISGFYEKIDKNNQETQTLTEIRNTLLPKLMSGEVRVAVEGMG